MQADSQIERVRFMIERAAREEAVFQMNDRFEELKVRLEAAQRLPMQALNALDRLNLEAQSRELCDSLAKQISSLQKRYEKEMAAKALLIELETRSCEYAFAKLQEEAQWFREKQSLWDLNVTLGDELQDSRKNIEQLYLLIHESNTQQESSTDPLIDEQHLLSLSQQREEATAVFEGKLQYLQQVRQFLMACCDREARRRSLASIALIKDCSSDEWMTTMQRERHESMMAILQRQHETEVLELKKQIKLLQKVKTVLHSQIDELTGKSDRMQLAYQESSGHVRQQTENVIRALTEEIEQEKQKLCDEQTRAQEERERLIREHDSIREELEKRLLELEEVNEKQRHWLTAAKREPNAQRVANEELVKTYQSLEKRRAAETNDMRSRIASQIKKINNIEMWNLSLKLKAKEAHAERIQMQKEMALQVQHHKQQQQLLRLKNWRHRVTAQAILTDVDLLFRFFADGLEILSGAASGINAALRENGAIEVIAALAQHCHQAPIKAICAKALGQLAWNANATKRSLGRHAKRRWFDWVSKESGMVLQKLEHENTLFNAVAEEEAAEMNWLADTSNGTSVGECDSEVVARYFDPLYAMCALTASSSVNGFGTNQERDAEKPEQEDTSDYGEDVTRQIREHALRILANSLFYNDANRQLIASERKWMHLIQRNCLKGHRDVLEHSARALCSLSYSDSIALAMGVARGHINNNSNLDLPYNGLGVFIRPCSSTSSALVQRNGLYGAINMCLHDANKTLMLDIPHGIETLVNLSGCTNKELCDPALEALELLADVRQFKKGGIASSNALAATDMKKLIALLSESTNPALVAMVSDAIADEVWKKPSAKVKLRNEHGLEKLLELCVKPLDVALGSTHAVAMAYDQEQKLLISCLWALRNTIADNVRNQDLVGALDGVKQLVLLYDRQRRNEEVVEAILAVLVALVMKHSRNSHQLVQCGLDVLIALAEAKDLYDARDEHDDHQERTILPPLVSPSNASSSPTKVSHNKTNNGAKVVAKEASSSRHQLQNAAHGRAVQRIARSIFICACNASKRFFARETPKDTKISAPAAAPSPETNRQRMRPFTHPTHAKVPC
ncbi:hypothetical protein FI667_g1942, partial [Globisporangium splendens]